jgi:hypothetical protein
MWPTGEYLADVTKQHWDKNLNPQYTCPTLADAYKSQLFGEDTSKEKCRQVQPQGKYWNYWETGSFFLFQDTQGAEVYHNNGLAVTLETTRQTKEFTVMSGSMNEKVQMLQVGFPDIMGLLDLLNFLRTHMLIVPSAGAQVRRACAPLRTGDAPGAVLSTDRL